MARVLVLTVWVSKITFYQKQYRSNSTSEFGLSCEYQRERKKRGKASRKDTAMQEQATAGSGQSHSPQDYSSEGPSPPRTANSQFQPGSNQSIENTSQPTEPQFASTTTPMVDGSYASTRESAVGQFQAQTPAHPQGLLPDPIPQSSIRQSSGISPTAMSLNGFSLSHDYDRPGMRGSISLNGVNPNPNGIPLGQMQHQVQPSQSYPSFGDTAYPAMSPPNLAASPAFRFGGAGESPLAGYFGASPLMGSPGWLNLPSPSSFQLNYRQTKAMNTLKFPVLQPLLPYIDSVIPVSLACDLLELYFTSSSTTHVHPTSPHILGYFFRRESFLRTTRPRPCSPALLSSMLWLAAQTSDSPFLTSPPSARGRVCQKLLEITIALLKPLVHGPPAGELSANGSSDSAINSVALGGLGVAMTGGDQLTADGGPLDNITTYIHLAVIVSASEYKAASMRWWNAAWTLARESRLNRELPPNPIDSENATGDSLGAGGVGDNALPEQSAAASNPKGGLPPNVPGVVSEEEREERRRVWWLLYTLDRHLALCYNRPLFLLDVECENLLQPLNDVDFQAGNFYGSEQSLYRSRGPTFLCTGHSMFGFFMPLMTILGYIVDLNQARIHPRFGLSSRHVAEWDDRAAEITSQLEAYGHSIQEFEAHHLSHSRDSNGQNRTGPNPAAPNRLTDSMIQTKIVAAYGTHIMHVLHILIYGKWDPINLLDDNDLWISTPAFQTAMSHAVAAAEAISNILEYDPDLSFMPWFFGISLLQGGFLFLLTAEKLAGEANPNVVSACENIIKAHEACIVTLNTEYQVGHPVLSSLVYYGI